MKLISLYRLPCSILRKSPIRPFHMYGVNDVLTYWQFGSPPTRFPFWSRTPVVQNQPEGNVLNES